MEELKNMTVGQLLDSEEFRKELALQIQNECDEHDKMMRVAFTKKLRLQRNPINSLREREVFKVDDVTAAYKLILVKELKGFSSAEREYIKRVCMVAYYNTLLKKKEQEQNPEKPEKKPRRKRKKE